ncbi:uncharacterized protein LOC141658541 [Silene latifolia]|uniref:uncharacterized protein LOC141658541 n=1 Tax=Silene latifolia TaxID=37657 RepID=UPI003D783414
MQKQITEVDVKVDLDGVAMAATQSYPAKSYTVPSPSNSGPNNSQNFGGQQEATNVWRRDGKKPRVVYYCERCQKHGHSFSYCWFNPQGRGRGRGRPSGSSHMSAGGRGYEAHVEEIQYEAETPCEMYIDHQGQALDTPDPSFVQAVAKEVFRLQNQNVHQNVHQSPNQNVADNPVANFAGPFH